MKWLADALGFGSKKANTSAQEAQMQQELDAFKKAIEDYISSPIPQYEYGGDIVWENAGPSAMEKITTDPRYKDAELAALRDLEQISKDGMSLQDQAELARLDSQVNRQNAGRMGAIRQNMAARGLGGSGMELVASMQAAQDATERQALASLEKAAMAQTGRRDATSRMGALASQLQGRDFAQEAAKAQAVDRINLFNTGGRNQTNATNMGRKDTVSAANTSSAIDRQDKVLGARKDATQMGYNSAADSANRSIAQTEAQNQRNTDMYNTLFGVGANIAAKKWL